MMDMTTLPRQMEAWRIAEDGSGTIQRALLPLPRPSSGEVLLRISHAGINRADLFQRQGTYPTPAETRQVPGLEAAGTIVGLGSGVTGFSVGDTVAALMVGGGYGEYCTAPAAQLLPVPPAFPLEQAAALPEALATVWLALVELAQLKAGETLLLHGGTSGIGTIGIQVARALGATVLATSGSDEKCALCKKLGAEAVNYKKDDFLAFTKAYTGGRGVEVVLDMVGGSYAERNIRALTSRGRLITIALLGGTEATVPLGGFLMKNISWQGVTLRSRTPREKTKTMREVRETLWPLVLEGTIKPVIDSVHPLAEVEKAHLRMQEGLHIGKIILSM